MTEELPFCECGKCGLRVTKKGNRFIHGHNKGFLGKSHSPKTCAKISKILENSEAVKAYAEARRGVPLPPEWCANLSKAHTGVPHSPEHNAANSKAHKESEAVKAEAERQHGGNDILKHHYIYDHNDLSKYTIEMTRSQHGRHHRNMRLLGIKVPHINTGHENEEELKLMEYIKKIETEV